MLFRCARCGVEVSRPVEPVTDPSVLRMGDQVDVVPEGLYCDWPTFDTWNRGENGADWNGLEPGSYVLNLSDMRNTKHGGRLIGCCGLDGLEGINTFCKNGHPVGTELSDCWTPRFIHLPAANVTTE